MTIHFDRRAVEVETLSESPRVVFGAGAEGAVADLLAELGARRVLLVALQRHAEGAERIARALGERAVGLFTTDQPQVPAEVADAAVERARGAGADWVLAHGGGTAIGVAKAVALELPVRVAAVPTTYAGSERTDVWGLIRDGRKTTGRDERVRPQLVVYDPELTSGLGRELSLYSLFNALAHSLEALYAEDATPAALRAAEESLQPLLGGLRGVGRDPQDGQGRTLALRGAALAAASLDGAAMGLHHKLAHVLGGTLGTPHARTHAVLLPHTFGFNAQVSPRAQRALRRAWNTDDGPAFLHDLQRQLGLETSLRALGVGEGDLDAIADEVLAARYPNPRPIDREAISRLLDDALHDRRPSSFTRERIMSEDAVERIAERGEPADELRHQSGFGNALASEALPNTLPRNQNSPRKVAHGLIAEQINGTGFTVRRSENRRTWMYRLRPQVLDRPFRPREHGRFTGDFSAAVPSPELLGYGPLAPPEEPTDFLSGLITFAGVGDACIRKGVAVHLYAANTSMAKTAFCNVDGDLLVVPQLGRLHVRTELGRLEVRPGEIAILPRGIRFLVELPDGRGRGFVAELFDGHFSLPERGPIGANGLADERHFLAPVADFEDDPSPWTVVVRQGGRMWEVDSPHGPFDVVAWHGNYAPFKYALEHFNSLGSVSFDHPDPSIMTVLTSPMDTRGRHALDVLVFRGRWDVSEGTFRPPFFHRNSASEFNCVISSPAGSRWRPGAFTFTPYLTPHGIAAEDYERAVTAPEEETDRPVRLPDDSLWIQFDSAYQLKVMPWMLDHPARDRDHLASFSDHRPGATLP